MSIIAARPADTVKELSPLARKKARARPLLFERKALDEIAASSMEYLAELGRATQAK